MQLVTKQENANKGTLDWQLTRFDLQELRSSSIEGYASKTSVYPGQTIDFMVSTASSAPFTIDIYRLGHYGGTGGRHMQHLGLFDGEEEEVPRESIERLRECNWKPSTTFRIPDDWVSGVYLAKLTRQEGIGAQSYIIFVVKEARKTDIVVVVSDLTWQAYNKWPRWNSIYNEGSNAGYDYIGPHVRVGFDRPYAQYGQIVDSPLSAGSGSFLLWEFPLAYWLEAEGYDVTYCSNLDLHGDPSVLDQCKIFISVGHDEYWTREMYDHATAARDAGKSLLFLCGNAICHEIILYDNETTAEPWRAFARGKRFADEQELMGASTYGPGYGDWTVVKPEHWVFEGTGMKKGDYIPGLIGWEYHGSPLKQTTELELLATSELIGMPTGKGKYTNPKSSGKGTHTATIYPGPKENWVFNAGTIWWAQGLSNPPGHIPAKGIYGRVQGPDPRVQQITKNLIERCLG